jgi:hypothetical protein
MVSLGHDADLHLNHNHRSTMTTIIASTMTNTAITTTFCGCVCQIYLAMGVFLGEFLLTVDKGSLNGNENQQSSL